MNDRVRVYNYNTYPYREKFKEQKIEIPPKGFIEMEYYEAVDFLGKMPNILFDAGGTPMPECYKKLRIVKPNDFQTELPKTIKCRACAGIFDDEDELKEHIYQNHLHLLEPDVKKELDKSGKK